MSGMMKHLISSTAISVFVLACTQVETPQSYAEFLKEHAATYPDCMETYVNDELVKQSTPQSGIYICLSQQRGRLYTNGDVAADWPISTGMDEHETPTGTFRILEKKKKHFSNIWGTIVDENDICVVASADARKDKVPPGCEFLGAKMENWQRLTNGGVGIHNGTVRGNNRLSHGCIRTPAFIGEMLYDITKKGSSVHISQEPEKKWPGTQTLQK